MSGNEVFKLKSGRGWSRGLDSLLRLEMNRWWGTRTWWVQILIWIGAVDMIVFTVMMASKASDEPVPFPELTTLYAIFGGLSVAIGVCIIMQGAVVGEKASGTAAWLLSKPVTHTAFVLSKMLSNAIGLSITAVIVPGMVAYLMIRLGTGGAIPLAGFLMALLVLILSMLYWLALLLMLGTIFNSRGPVIGIPLVLLLGFNFILGMAPWITKLIPYELAFPTGIEGGSPSVAAAVINGEAVASWLPVYTAIVMIFLFIGVAIFRFSREDL